MHNAISLLRLATPVNTGLFCLLIVVACGTLSACRYAAIAPQTQGIGNFVTVDDGVRLYYTEKGQGSTVLVAPAALYLEPHLLQQLAKNRRVIFYDPRNRGRSDRVELSRVSLEIQVKDLESLRQTLGLERMALLGWSSYGLEMAVYAMRYPERVSRLIQLAPLAPAASIRQQASRTQEQTNSDAAVAELERRKAAGDFVGRPEDYCRRSNALTDPAYFADPGFIKQMPDVCELPNEWPQHLRPYFEAFYSGFGNYDWRPGLSRLNVPRLVIHGREDRLPIAGAEAWVAGYPNARLMVIPASGHFPYIEQKAIVTAAIETFLTGDWPATARIISVRHSAESDHQ
ncbi:MAG: alpha/beta hydrolase [Gammaproteobacteria bacterium]|nr:alpha/beta hydrolase [Gammaproteobacteria bacterium]